MICKSQTRATAALLRNLLASDLAAGRSPGRRCVPYSSTGSRLPGNPGGRCCRSGRPTNSARRTEPPRPLPARRCLLAEPLGTGVRSERSRTSSRATRTGRASGRGSAGPGALADQVRFEREWTALRDYARLRGIRLIGDVPIYVSDEGADVEAWPELFESGEVAGAPPDALSANGQHWGNPLYDWPVHRATGYHWWIERFRRVFELVDLSRIDHFRGFVSYWAIPAELHDRTTRQVAARAGRRALSCRRRRARRPAR